MHNETQTDTTTHTTPPSTRPARGRRGGAAVLALAALAIASPSVQAQVIDWVGYQNSCMNVIPDNASWFHGDNWLGFEVPGAETNAYLGWGNEGANPGYPTYIHFGDFCVNVFACPNPIFLPAGDAKARTVTLFDDDWVFDLGPGTASGGGSCSATPSESGTLKIGLYLTIGGQDINGDAGSATLTILNGPVYLRPSQGLIPLVRIGGFGSSSGRLTVRGSDAVLDVDGQILIGMNEDVSGTLRIESGGQVVVGGNEPNISGLCFVARRADSSGSLVVDGPGSQWSSRHQLAIGHRGSGEMTVSEGAAVVTGKAESPSNSSGIVAAQASVPN